MNDWRRNQPGKRKPPRVLAIELATRFSRTVPSVEILKSDYGMSTATAYRWRQAFAEARNPK